MRKSAIIAFILGLFLLSALIAWQGAGQVLDVARSVGWNILWLPIYSVIPLFFAVRAWQCLFIRNPFPIRQAVYPAITGLSINWLLPAVQVGGEFARLQIGLQRGQDPTEACATAVWDKLIQLATQVIFTLLGLGWLWIRFSPGSIGWAIAVATLVFTILIIQLWRMQARGFFRSIHRWAGRFSNRLTDWKTSAEDMDEALLALQRHPGLLLRATFHRMAFRLLMVGETWLALHFLGQDAGLGEALILESTAQAIRLGTFFIPAGLGTQEGGLVAIGALMGIPTEACLASSLCKRVRELAIGLPNLWYWQADQARRSLRRNLS